MGLCDETSGSLGQFDRGGIITMLPNKMLACPVSWSKRISSLKGVWAISTDILEGVLLK